MPRTQGRARPERALGIQVGRVEHDHDTQQPHHADAKSAIGGTPAHRACERESPHALTN